MKLYHYTKGVSINSIFTDGFIATEGKRGINRISHLTECVWLTEKTRFPRTAMPYVSLMPETNLMAHIGKNAPFVDLDRLGDLVGGVFRFSFDSTDTRFKKWWFSKERKSVENNIEWRTMESIANKVGDEVRSFWISSEDVQLNKFSLEVFANGVWKMILNDVSLSTLNEGERSIIETISERSKKLCLEHGLPVHQVKLAA